MIIKKNKLAAVPMPAFKDDLFRQGLYTVCEQTKLIDGKRVQILNIWDEEQRPYLRVFRYKQQFITEVFLPKYRWSEAMLSNFAYKYYGYGQQVYYFKSFNDNDLAMTWQRYQEDVRKQNLLTAFRNRKLATERLMADMRPLPKNIEAWLDKVLFLQSRYLYYKTVGKNIVGHCTHCKKEVTLPRPAQGRLFGQAVKCPHCKSMVTLRPAGISNTVCDKKNFAYLQKVKGGFCVRIFYCIKDFRKDYLNPDQEMWESGRSFFVDGVWRHYMWEYKYINQYVGHVWGWYRTDELVKHNMYYYIPIDEGGLYTQNIAGVLKDTPYQYCQISDFAKHMNKPFSVVEYLKLYSHYPQIEYLVKMGLYNLTAARVKNGYSISSLNLSGHNPEAVLGVHKKYFGFLRQLNPTVKELEVMQVCSETGRHLSIDEVRFFAEQARGIDNICFCLKHATAHKLIKYFAPRLENKTKPIGFVDWEDYITAAERLGWDVKSSFVLFPQDFWAAHDRAIEHYAIEEDAIMDKLAQARQDELNDLYGFANKSFFVVAPKNAGEIIKEGATLGHCVGGYVDSHCSGKTNILFVRKISEPDTPFYTLEVQNNKIVQCRGKCNCSYTANPLLKKFIEKFKAKKLSQNQKNQERLGA